MASASRLSLPPSLPPCLLSGASSSNRPSTVPPLTLMEKAGPHLQHSRCHIPGSADSALPHDLVLTHSSGTLLQTHTRVLTCSQIALLDSPASTAPVKLLTLPEMPLCSLLLHASCSPLSDFNHPSGPCLGPSPPLSLPEPLLLTPHKLDSLHPISHYYIEAWFVCMTISPLRLTAVLGERTTSCSPMGLHLLASASLPAPPALTSKCSAFPIVDTQQSLLNRIH